MLQNEFIQTPPARNLPDSSTLSLLTGASLFDPAHIEKGELPETVTVDVSQWDVTLPQTHMGATTGTRVIGYEIGINRHSRRSYFSPGYLEESQHRSATQLRAIYEAVDVSGPGPFGEWNAGPLSAERSEDRKAEWAVTGLLHIDDALRLILSTFLPHTARHVAARGDDPLACLRELSQLQFASGAYAAGLRTLKEASLYLAALPEARGINRQEDVGRAVVAFIPDALEQFVFLAFDAIDPDTRLLREIRIQRLGEIFFQIYNILFRLRQFSGLNIKNHNLRYKKKGSPVKVVD